MTKAMTLISGIGLGAGLMYVLDPDRGNRRRALIRDKAARSLNKTGDAIGVTSRDISHRTRGLVSGLTTLFSDDQATDEVIVARVRSKMGRVVSHPGSVEVTASQGRVTLSGPILTAEARDLLKCVSSVKGVESVESRLELHDTADNVPGLQGGSRRPGQRFEFMQTNWSPAARLVAGTVGGTMMLYCSKRQDAVGMGLGTLGFTLFMRSLTNRELKRMVGMGGGREGTENQENVNTPGDEADSGGRASGDAEQPHTSARKATTRSR